MIIIINMDDITAIAKLILGIFGVAGVGFFIQLFALGIAIEINAALEA